MNKFDVIIPVATKDVDFMSLAVKYVRLNIIGTNKIIAITNGRNVRKLTKSVRDTDFVVLDENNLEKGLSFSEVRRLLHNAGEDRPSQTGWYFQQFLKYAFGRSNQASEYYLSWDADTLPINKIEFFEEGKPMFTRKIEYHAPYFDTIKRLLGIDRQVDYSFIAEHMMFNSNIVKELTEEIMKSGIAGDTWFEKIINACDFSAGKANLYSEFETYGNFCVKYYPELYDTRTLNTFRAAGLIRGRNINEHIIERLSMDLHIASFEMQDAPFPYNIAWNVYRVKRKLLSILRSSGGVDRGSLDLHLSPIIVVKAA